MDDVDLNLLRPLDALLTHASVTAAARHLQLSTSAMSRTLARLRAVTGDALLVRAGREMVLTPRAVQLREQVRQVALEAKGLLQPSGTPLKLSAMSRQFHIRTNEGFVEAFGARLIAALAAEAPKVRLCFVHKPEKNSGPLREGAVDLEVGVQTTTAPELRMQALFRDRFIGVVRAGHALAGMDPLTPQAYAAFGHVVVSRHGRAEGPVDLALAELGLTRRVAAVVTGFSAAVQIARESDLVALVPSSCLAAPLAAGDEARRAGLFCFQLPVRTEAITVSQMWHPRFDADPAHRWLRSVFRAVCCEPGAREADA